MSFPEAFMKSIGLANAGDHARVQGPVDTNQEALSST